MYRDLLEIAPMADVNDRLKEARQDAGYSSARQAADALGENYNTYAATENGRRGLTAKKAEQYARKFNVSLEWLLTGKGKHAAPPQLQPISAFIPIVGRVAAGLWQEVDTFSDEPTDFIPYMPGLPYSSDCYFCLVVEGQSMNRIFQDGARLMCLDLAASGVAIKEGDIAIVERLKEQDGLREVTAKRVRRVGDTLELWPESTEKQFQYPIRINGAREGETITIKARVVGVYTEI